MGWGGGAEPLIVSLIYRFAQSIERFLSFVQLPSDVRLDSGLVSTHRTDVGTKIECLANAKVVLRLEVPHILVRHRRVSVDALSHIAVDIAVRLFGVGRIDTRGLWWCWLLRSWWAPALRPSRCTRSATRLGCCTTEQGTHAPEHTLLSPIEVASRVECATAPAATADNAASTSSTRENDVSGSSSRVTCPRQVPHNPTGMRGLCGSYEGRYCWTLVQRILLLVRERSRSSLFLTPPFATCKRQTQTTARAVEWSIANKSEPHVETSNENLLLKTMDPMRDSFDLLCKPSDLKTTFM